ncbi:MAG TPA: N-acetyltransferase [Actinobacteria bacterium]|jgi:GNAT superfamily N-acetyltransferase|nr:N-acetyltransferase [Actinomycetota bacterium]
MSPKKIEPTPVYLEPIETTLTDGTPVLCRPIRPTDKELLRRGFERLSDESRLRRFLTPIHTLSDELVRYLTEVDQVNHIAWVAVRGDQPNEGLGVARSIRVPGEPAVAEAAITVIDDYQNRGLGMLLLSVLGVSARSAGVTAFRALVMQDNTPMLDLLRQLGAVPVHDSPGVVRMDVPLDPARLPDSPAGRVLKAVATNLIPVKVRPMS